jgi:hypothetical protein
MMLYIDSNGMGWGLYLWRRGFLWRLHFEGFYLIVEELK